MNWREPVVGLLLAIDDGFELTVCSVFSVGLQRKL